MKYIFGPVPSRRLGISLGIDIIPFKTCTLSCIYCQIGNTPQTTLERKEYTPVSGVLAEISGFLAHHPRPDWITFSGSGEPTLHSGLGRLIRGVKAITNIPTCVITNGTLFFDPAVRRDVLEADAVMPSLDSAREETFRVICQNHPGLHVSEIIRGLADFRREYHGKIWLEIMLVDGMNDTPEDLSALRDAVQLIQPDAIHLNTVVRPPADRAAKSLSPERMEEIRKFFGEKAEVIASFTKEKSAETGKTQEDILEYIKRRPGSAEDLSAALGIEKEEVEKMLEELKARGEVREVEHWGKKWWEWTGERK
ncbi:MAG: radical SAM protein [Candidatus Latescibacter sp.]|nr:radical SAM protein [Candidatus Latescibacter sp.]